MRGRLATAAATILTALVAAPLAAQEKNDILIVDMGNIMRSVIAENLIERRLEQEGLADGYTVASRGLQGTPGTPVVPTHANLSYYNEANGSNAWESSLPALEELGLVDAIKGYKATVVSEGDLDAAEIILVTGDDIMNDEGYGLNTQFPGYGDKMVIITELVGSAEGIADAYQPGTAGNKYADTVYQVADVVERGFEDLIDRLD